MLFIIEFIYTQTLVVLCVRSALHTEPILLFTDTLGNQSH